MLGPRWVEAAHTIGLAVLVVEFLAYGIEIHGTLNIRSLHSLSAFLRVLVSRHGALVFLVMVMESMLNTLDV